VGVSLSAASSNGEDAVVLRRAGQVIAVVTVAASDDGIDQVLWLMNPEKLAAA
jgi:hypothetical protein